jgi:hypothetical protein
LDGSKIAVAASAAILAWNDRYKRNGHFIDDPN